MPSTYTQNLGVELPATGEQANTWGLTVNRNMDTLDTAINGSTQVALTSSPYLLAITDGSQSPLAANPFITWTGAQTGQVAVHIDWQSARQHLYIMSNRTSGGFAIAFAQGAGSQFVLQAGYDAILYSDGGGANANVGAALASPQFTNVLATGTLTLGSSVISSDAQGNVHLTGGLGVGNPTAIPDPLTITGINYGQLRLVQGNYGVILRNDATNFYLLITASGDAYGNYVLPPPLHVDLASRCVGLGGSAASAAYGLTVPSIHTGSILADTTLQVGGAITGNTGLSISGARSYFRSADATVIGLWYAASTSITWIGTNANSQFQVSNANGFSMFAIDQSGNAALGGQLQVGSGGVKFSDGTVQTTAGATGTFPGNVTVGGVINGPSSAFLSPVLFCPAYSGNAPSIPANSIAFSHNDGSNWVTIWLAKSDGSVHFANIPITS
jgi:hypothetical protein